MKLRKYQEKAIIDIRNAFKKSKRVFFCLPTGAGKTFIFSHIAKSAVDKKNNTWIVCPRNELIWQSVESCKVIGVEPNVIAPGYDENENNLHVVSKDTWIRRRDKIKQSPDFVIVDEGHLATDRYIDMINTYPNARFLFVSATPERMNGQDLTALAPSDSLVYGPSIDWLIQNKYLSKIKYLCPPVSGLESLKKIGTEIDKEQLREWISEKKIYSTMIDSYNKHCIGKQTIAFCRDIKHCEEAAKIFNDAGFKFEPIDGTMARKKIRSIIDAVRRKELDGITSCELVTYGLDVPNVKAIVMLRPTFSRPLYYQMVGRGLRFTGENDELVVLDHVGNAIWNCDGKLPWKQPEWNYSGNVKRSKNNRNSSIKYCPYNDFTACDRQTCVGCKLNPNIEKPIDRWEEIDGDLVPIIDGEKSDRCLAEKKYFANKLKKILSRIKNSNGTWNSKAVSDLLDFAKTVGHKPLWCYYAAKKSEIHPIDEKLLSMICKKSGYKSGWVEHAKSFLMSKK